MLRLDDCLGRPEAGNKAERLARVRAAGLPALDGVVLPAAEPVEDTALEATLRALGGERFAVRSSSNLEDAPGGSAAGVFTSVIGAEGLAEVKAAIARVRASAQAEPARAYLGHSNVEMAVLIQPLVRAERLGVAMSSDGGWQVEERRAGEPEWGDVTARRVEAGPLAELLQRLQAIEPGPIIVEYASDKDITYTLLQVRPRSSGPVESLEAAFNNFVEPGRWRLDAEHNPRPLSAAQAGLVALVDELGVGSQQRVVAGWLFAGGQSRNLHPLPLPDLRRRFDEEVAPDCLSRIAAAQDLPQALDAFLHMYRRLVGEVTPSVARARAQLDQFLQMNLHEPLSQHGDLLSAVGGAAVRRDQALRALAQDPSTLDEYLKNFGAWAPGWDVAVPSDSEAVERVWAMARSLPPLTPRAPLSPEDAARALLERLDRMARRAFKALLPTVRAAMQVGEDDDAIFFAAQQKVRRALLALALPLDHPDDVFDLPLPLVRAGGAQDWRALALAGRAARVAAGRVVPPLAIEDGRPHHALPSSARVLRGHATSGRARGRAVVVLDPAAAPTALPADVVLVVPAILPSLAYLLPACRALVTAHGGATSHGATLAREYGIVAVLGARGAEAIADGAELFVDGSEGRVYLL